MTRGIAITAGNRRALQVRKTVRAAFSGDKQQIFLDHLAACCNVTRAAEAAGAGVSTVYDLRRRDPAFADAWAEAIEAGYATLEALLIERAAVGGSYTPGDTLVPGPETIDTWLALDLLRLSRAGKAPRNSGGAPPRRATDKALAEKIVAKLDVLALRRRSGQARRVRGKGPLPSPGSVLPQDERRRERIETCTPDPLTLPSPHRGEGDSER